MALLAHDAEAEWGREGLVTGKEAIRSQAERLFADFDFTYGLSDLQVEAGRVSY